ncbi:MAG: hypothetical protein ACK5QC_03710 [Bacteroidota bacterium]|jgi:hypothetical protein
MENSSIENIIKASLQNKEFTLDLPPVQFIDKASKVVAGRKKTLNANNDIFYVIAQFLNLKIKMYQVIVLFVCGISIYLYFDNAKNKIAKSNTINIPQEINTPINSYTVMACVKETKII